MESITIPTDEPLPLFSILVPVFNAGPYLERAVESALAQTEPRFELIVVDDGSTDGAVDRLPNNDSRIRILRQPNQGAALASNAGLAAARGSLIAILDQDDIWLPAKLKQHRLCFDLHPDVAFNFTWSHYIGPTGERLPLPPRRWSGRTSFELLYRDFVIGNTSSVAIRRSAIERAGGFDPAAGYLYDLELILRIALQGPENGMAVNRDLCGYRRHPGQMSRKWEALRKDWEALTERLELQTTIAPATRRQAESNLLRYLSFLAHESGDHAASLRLLGEGFLAGAPAALGEWRNWKMLGLIGARAVLPRGLFEWMLSRYARG